MIVALIIRKTAKIQVPLCDRHVSKRWKMIGAAWFLCLGGLALAIVGGSSSTTQEMSSACAVIGIVTFLVGLVVSAILSQLIVVKKIDNHLIWLKKINRSFLNELQEPARKKNSGFVNDLL